jgi:hypothetical protein
MLARQLSLVQAALGFRESKVDRRPRRSDRQGLLER